MVTEKEFKDLQKFKEDTIKEKAIATAEKKEQEEKEKKEKQEQELSREKEDNSDELNRTDIIPSKDNETQEFYCSVCGKTLENNNFKRCPFCDAEL